MSTVAETFNQFARSVYHDRSPLYERLALRVAEDPEILAIAAYARKGTALPNLFFGAVHLLLLKGVKHPLSAFYLSLTTTPARLDYSYPYFRSFALEHQEEIRKIISTRLVQTNDVGRCAVLVPAFEIITRQTKGRSLSLVEAGASAGLTLLWDHYGYNYGAGLRCGDLASRVQIECSLHGDKRPPLPVKFPRIAFRVGVDLNPINLNDAESVLWLRALVWPEHQKRSKMLQTAVQLARQQRPRVVQGDARELLPDMLDRVREEEILCVVHSFVLSFLSQETRDQLSEIVARAAKRRPVFLVSMEWYEPWERAQLWLTRYDGGRENSTTLAYCGSHGEWLEWLGKVAP